MTRDLLNESLAAAGENGTLSPSGHPPRRSLWRAPRLSWAGTVWGAAALCAVAASLVAAPEWRGAFGGALAVAMIAIAAVDARQFIIPDKLVLAGLILGLADAALADPRQAASGLAEAALRAFAFALVFYLFRAVYRRVRGRQGIGLGDVKLAAVAGVWLGWGAAALALEIAALSALAAVLIGACRGRRITRTMRIPFGLFLAPAIWLAWLLSAVFPRAMP